MPKTINLTGKKGETYDLDELSQAGTRSDGTSALKVQIWYWNPDLPSSNDHSKPNPPNPAIGQIWMSRLITDKTSDEYKLIVNS